MASARSNILLLAAFVLIVVGAKLMLINNYGSNVPFWDQWDSEAILLYAPYLKGTLALGDLFSPHNEHRILVTRLYSILLLELNGLWIPKLQMVANAIVHAAVACLIIREFSRSLPRLSKLTLWAFSSLAVALPFGWENTLAGFQSQFYFVLGFSLLAVYLMIFCQAFSSRWMLGIVALLFAGLSMSSGVLTPIAVVAVCVIQMFSRCRHVTIREVIGLVVLILGFLVAFRTVPVVAHHESLKASSIIEFVQAFLLVAEWPSNFSAVFAVFQNLPIVALVVMMMMRREQRSSPTWFLVGAMAWVGLQWISFAYGRVDAPTSSRYADTLTMGLLVNASAALHLFSRLPRTKMPVAGWIIAATIVTAYYGVIPLSVEVPSRHAAQELQQINLHSFIQTGDINALRAQPFFSIPYPDPDRLAMIVSDPSVRSILHPEVTGAAWTADLSLPNRFNWLVRATQLSLLILSPALVGLGMLLLALAAFLELRFRATLSKNNQRGFKGLYTPSD